MGKGGESEGVTPLPYKKDEGHLALGRERQRRRENGVKMGWLNHAWAQHATFYIVFDVHALKVNLSNDPNTSKKAQVVIRCANKLRHGCL